MKNSISKSACFLIPFFIFLLSYDLFSQEIKVRVIKPNARIMLQPNSESLEIQKIPLGAVLIVEETIGEWIKVVLPESDSGLIVKGYIYSKFVEYEVSRFRQKEPEKESVGAFAKPEKTKPSHMSSDYQYDDYSSWNRAFELAKEKKRTGDSISILGSVIWGIATILYWADLEEETSRSGYTTTTTWTKKSEYLYISLGGVFVGLLGYAISNPATQEIRLLELEGARKGYIKASLGPTINGVMFRLEYAF